MKFWVALLTVTIGALVALDLEADEVHDREIIVKWVQFKSDNNKSYHHSEERHRRALFARNDQFIENHNKRNRSWKAGHNRLSDKTEEEMRAMLGTFIPPSSNLSRSFEEFYEDRDLVDLMMSEDRQSSVDYRTHRCIGAVKNQGSCGSCWAFSALSSLEFSHCKARNAYVSLSEQQIVDCDKRNLGCNGGWPYDAWGYLITAGGSQATSSYAYTARGGTCRFTSSRVVAKVASRGYVPAKNVAAMQAALVKYGPLSVAIQVLRSFNFYRSGIYSDSACPSDTRTVNHAVNIVGYGPGYWIVRNSWGTTWGDRGYILIRSGVNMCNIESWPMYVAAA